MASPLQLEAGKLPPVPLAGFAKGNEAEEGRAAARYVHTIGTSSKACAWSGSSADGADFLRREQRDKVVSQVVNSLNRCGREKQAKALATCGKWFDVWANAGGQVKLLPCPCDSMFCPECASRRSRPLIKKLSTLVNRPGRSYWFLTLTVPNTLTVTHSDISGISEQFAELWKSWVFQGFEDEKRMTRKIYGGVRSIECVYEPNSRSWHPHIHVLFEGPKRLPEWWLVLLKAAWFRITGDARYLHLQRAYTVTRQGKKKFNHLNMKALREVCKYVTKCAEFAGDFLLVDEFVRAFKCVRRTQAFGSFHGKAVQGLMREPGEDDPAAWEDESRLSDDGYVRLPFRAALSDTVMLSNGERQLKFAFMERVTAFLQATSPPLVLEPEVTAVRGQMRIGFAGAMPEKSVRQPSLYEDAA